MIKFDVVSNVMKIFFLLNCKKLNLVFCSVIVLAACSHGVFSLPPPSVNYYENQNNTGRAVRVDAWGLIVDTNEDSGLIIGKVIKTYFYEGTSNQDTKTYHEMMQKFNYGNEQNNKLFEVEVSDHSPLKHSTAYAYSVMGKGIMFNTNTQRFGFNIGNSVYERVYLPKDFNGLFFINSNLSSKKPGDLFIQKKEQQK